MKKWLLAPFLLFAVSACEQADSSQQSAGVWSTTIAPTPTPTSTPCDVAPE